MTATPEPTPTDRSVTDRLIAELRAEADSSPTSNDGPNSTRADRNGLMRRAAQRIQVQQGTIERLSDRVGLSGDRVTYTSTGAVARPRELTREDAIGMVLSRMTLSAESTNPVRLAQSVLDFTRETDEVPPRGDWELPEGKPGDDEYLRRVVFQALGAASTAWSQAPRGVFDDGYARSIGTRLLQAVKAYAEGNGPHVEIGGQKMTQAQFDAARFPLLNTASEAVPPAHGLAVGDKLDAERANAAPEGTALEDKDGDRLVVADGHLLWDRYGTMPTGERKYAPYTVTKVPEDRTPRLGDRVRVIGSAVGADPERNHEWCFGQVGTLRRSEGWPGCFAINRTGGNSGSHVGPLSDFELVERAK